MAWDNDDHLSSHPKWGTTVGGMDYLVEQHQSTSDEAGFGQLSSLEENQLVGKDVMTAPSISRAVFEIEEEDIQGGGANPECEFEIE